VTGPGRLLEFGAFEVLTFDCYGTLIDWETGILAGLRAVLGPRGVEAQDDDLLERYAGHEAALEAGPYLPYRVVLARALAGVAKELGVTPSESELAAFGGSVGDWPAFPDSAAALAGLATRYRLGSSPTATTTCSPRPTGASESRSTG